MEDFWQQQLLTKPVAVIQVDQKNCFGQLEYTCIDEAVTQNHPTIGPFTLWKHSHTSQVTQGTAGRTKQDKGAQQGDVAGSFEASVALAEQARSARLIHQAQADGLLPWATPTLDPNGQATAQLEWQRTMDNDQMATTDP